MKSIAITYTPYLNRLNALFAAVIALSVFFYGVFLLEAVANAAKRTDAQKELSAITTHIGEMETGYLAATRDLTLDSVKAMGYVAPAGITTVLADGSMKALSENR
ncbi:MAG TPA: hypothetical protein VG934_01290 [Candidatus Paceibacterota bacterium]|nr:hypothetical protein [Candidatus Paceibacterota bacterium]